MPRKDKYKRRKKCSHDKQVGFIKVMVTNKLEYQYCPSCGMNKWVVK